MKKTLILLFVLALGLQISANEYVTFVKVGKAYHLIDQTGETISKQPMTKVMAFYNGYASCVINKKWHYLDQQGNAFTVAMEVDKLHAVQEGVGAFMAMKSWGFMDLKGEIVISPVYQSVEMFKDGKCWVKQGDKWFQINKEGKALFSGRYDKFHPFVDGIARVKQGDFWGYINEAGENIAGGFIYSDCRDFVDGNAFVKMGSFWGVIDKQGDFVVMAQYSKVNHFFENGYAFVKQGDFLGIMNSDGTMLVEPTYKKIEDFQEGYCGAIKTDKWEVIDRQGKVVITGLDKFTKFQEGYAIVHQNEQLGLLTTTGEIKLQGEYDNIKPFVNGFALVKKGDLWGYINANLEEAITPQFLAAKDFNAEWTIAKTASEKWGYINQSGEIVIEATYDNANYFVRNLQADIDYGCDQTTFINSGISSMFSKTKMWFDKKDMEDTDVAVVKIEGKWAFIDKEGKVILSGLDNAEPWVNGFARFRQYGKWGVVNLKGEIVVKPLYDKIFEMTKVCE